MKRRILKLIDAAALGLIALSGATENGLTPIAITLALALIPCVYIGVRMWAEKKAANRKG